MMKITKSSYLVIITLVLLPCIYSAAAMEEDPIREEPHDVQAQKEKEIKSYKYLQPATKVEAGWFKDYQFDLRFKDIKESKISKNLLEGAIDFLGFKWTHQTKGKKKPKNDQDFQLIDNELPMVPTNFKQKTEIDIRYTWIGHSTAVIQIGPDNFIIDPVFTEKKVQKRYRPPACKVKELPKIDVVLISHDHYDHFDSKSILEINQEFSPLFVAGLGTEDILPKGSKMKVMDWMDQISVKLKGGEYKITFVPACHWSRRWIADLNKRLWGGFVIETPFKQKIYYSGDTGYCEVFKQIGEKYGPFDLAILPIGAYEPRELLKPQHINPEQAVLIHKEIRSKQSVAVHWGTLSMGREGFAQPKYDLITACNDHGLKQGEFITVLHGESRIF